MRNVANVAKRQIAEARVVVNGVTASAPMYIEVDSMGNKEWVVDVYIGPSPDSSIVYKVPIVPAAKSLITDIRQPVQLERSKQGFYTVVGRAKVLSAGAQAPDGSILEPTYREIEVNLAELDILHVADLDYSAEVLQLDGDTVLQADENEVLQVVTATDAFGHEVTDEGECADPGTVLIDPVRNAKTRHVVIDVAMLGPYGDPLAMRWGDPDSVLQPAVTQIIELED